MCVRAGPWMNDCFYMWSPIILRQTTPTKQFTSRPVLQMNICIFIRNIYCINFNIEPCIKNYLQKKKKKEGFLKTIIIFPVCLFSLFGADWKFVLFIFPEIHFPEMLSTRTLKHFALQLWCKISVWSQAEVKRIQEWKYCDYLLTLVSFRTHMMLLETECKKCLEKCCAALFHTAKAYKIIIFQIVWSPTIALCEEKTEM